VLDIPLPEVDRVAKLVPAIPGKPISIPKALETVTAFQEAYQSAPYIKDMIDTASKLEGVARNAGTHAAGVIISDGPITEYVPLHRPTGGNTDESPIGALTQFEMNVLDSIGMLKVDFLGLSTLTVMARACEMIRDRHGIQLDIHSIPLDDPATYELLGRGEVLGVFQVEGAGMRRYLMDMKPRELANVVAMVALYRPGPLEFIPTYINRMHGREKVTYRHAALESIFEETYGIPVYQEQIMFAAMELAGYSPSEADDLRKAIAKKKAKSLKKHREKFITGATQQGVDKDIVIHTFDDWENFARYGFNKAHAADYGVIAVQTAYLKAHFPIEYMTALMSVFKHDNDKVAIYIADCRRMGIDVLPPDINTSGLDFQIEDVGENKAAIRFGLGAVKNVGEGAIKATLDARVDDEPFETIIDFARRVDLRQVGKRALESLIRVGALDALASRISLLDSLDRIISLSISHFRAAEVGQMSLFGGATGVPDSLTLSSAPSDVPRRRQLRWEKELIGVYVSDHPLTPHMEGLAKVVTHFSAELADADHGHQAIVAGEISHIRPYQTRSGKPMGFVTLEDLQGTVDLVVFNRVWREVSSWLQPGTIVLVKGKVDNERGEPKLLADLITTDLSGSMLRDVSMPSQPRHTKRTIVSDPLPSVSTPLVDEVPPLPEDDPWDESIPLEINELYMQDTDVGPVAETGEVQLIGDKHMAEPENLGKDEASEDRIADPGSLPFSSADPLRPDFSGDDRLQQSDPRMITVVLRSTGDQLRDALRMRRVHGLLTSYPGNDRFVFHVFEISRRYHLEFPSSSTGYCRELLAQLHTLLGEDSIQVEPLRFQ
jgi:DNA polymerase-3 subunit alpha